MTGKSITIYVLGAGIIAGGLVYDGMSRRHAASSGPTNTQTATALASTQANVSTNDAQAQPAASTGSTNQTASAAQPQVDANTTAANTTPGEVQPASDAAQPAASQPTVIPAGTALTIRLGEKLGSSLSSSNQDFSATLDKDVVIDGQTVIAAGAGVTGKVVLARPAGALAGEATLQLKVVSLNINNNDLAVSSSTQSFGPKVKGKNRVGRFMKGLVKRAEGDEHEVVLAKESAYSFTLKKNLQIE